MEIILIPALSAFILNMVLTPCIIKIALKFGWYDTINDRKIHSGNIPRLGGVGIFLSFIFSFSLFYFILNKENNFNSFQSENLASFDWKMFSFYFSISLIFLTGLIDDFSELSARLKLIIQIAVAISLVVAGFLFTKITIPFTNIVIDLGFFSYILTFLWFIGIINAINLIDGMDGLSGGTTFLSLLFLGILGLLMKDFFITYICFILASALLGFLIFNLPPAKIFMGDSGSLFLGTILSILPVAINFSALELNCKNLEGWILFIACFLFIVPIFDTLSAIFRRVVIMRVHFFTPDKEHLHHKLLFLGLSTRKALLVIYSINFTGGSIALALAYFEKQRSLILVLGIIFFVTIFFTIGSIYRRTLKKAC